jgi:hypothetical protein
MRDESGEERGSEKRSSLDSLRGGRMHQEDQKGGLVSNEGRMLPLACRVTEPWPDAKCLTGSVK